MNSDSLSDRIRQRRGIAIEAFLRWVNMEVDRWNDMKWQDWSVFQPIAHLGIRFGFINRMHRDKTVEVRCVLCLSYGGRVMMKDIEAESRFLGFGLDENGAARNAMIAMLEKAFDFGKTQ